MKEEKVSIITIARYHFHNLLVKGTFARVIAFATVTAALCLILGFILSLVPGPDGNLLASLWKTTLCALDGGTIAGMEANTGQKAVLFIITLFGIVFSSVLVGIITTGIEERLEDIAHEGSKVLERRSHVLVLGCASMTAEILRSLAQNYERGRHVEPIVVLDEEHDIVEVSKKLDFELEEFSKTKTIYRQGCPYSKHDLGLCSIEHARAILITAQSDDEAVKTVLVCTALLQELRREVPLFVVCEQEDVFASLQSELGEPIYLINPDHLLASAVETMRGEHPSTQICVAGQSVAVSDQASRLLIAANDCVEHEESDDLVIRTLLELYSLCERRRALGNPLEIDCMLYYEKNVEPAKRAGVTEAVLVGQLLADKISGLIEHAQAATYGTA